MFYPLIVDMFDETDFNTEFSNESDESESNGNRCLVLANAFDQLRHLEPIHGIPLADNQSSQSWRMKDRVCIAFKF